MYVAYWLRTQETPVTRVELDPTETAVFALNFFEVSESAHAFFGVVGAGVVMVATVVSLAKIAVWSRRWGAVHAPGSAVDNVVYRASDGSVFVFDFRFKPDSGWEAQILRQPSYRGRDPALDATCRGRSTSRRPKVGMQPPWLLPEAREQAARWADLTVVYVRTGVFSPFGDSEPGSWEHPLPCPPRQASDSLDAGVEYRTSDGQIFVFDFRRRRRQWHTFIRGAPGGLPSEQMTGCGRGMPAPRPGAGRATSLQQARDQAAAWAERAANYLRSGEFADQAPDLRGGYVQDAPAV